MIIVRDSRVISIETATITEVDELMQFALRCSTGKLEAHISSSNRDSGM